MVYHFRIHNDPDGYWAEAIELKGCVTQGDTLEELQENMREALNLYLDEPSGSGVVDSLPNPAINGPDIARVQVEPRIAIKTALRYNRAKARLSQRQIAKAIGHKSIYGYQRYESGKANPTLDMLVRFKRVLPGLDLNMLAESETQEKASQ